MREILSFNNYIKIIFTLCSCLLNINAYAANEQNNDITRMHNMIESKPHNEALNLPSHDFRSTNLDMQSLLIFKNSNFEKANFSGTSEKPKVITNIDFTNCSMNDADFSNTIITNCKFNNAKLNRANFKNAVIKFSSFRGAKLTYSDFTSSNQESVGFDSANLQCSKWDSADIFRLSFTRTDERGISKKQIKESHCSHENTIRTGLLESFKCP